MLSRGWVVAVLCCVLQSTWAQQSGLKAIRVSQPPVIDGVVNDDEWKDVPFIEGLHDANTGAAYADDGRFWLAYDRNNIYFAARLKESEPHAIHATEYRTNVALSGDDYVELDLDLSGSMSAFNKFQINPQGATNIQIASGRAAKREWLGAFIAKGRITETGWEVEAKIPWNGMDIPHGGKRDIRYNILRFISKNQRNLVYTFVPPTQTGLTPTWAGVELPKPEVDHSLKLLPYTYVGYDSKTKSVVNAGIDMKTALTDQINLVGSVNPDFRNIENQILSIDFSRFERLAGETRPFFQEGRQYSNSQLFASQRIHSFDAGLNSYGRVNDQISFSVINTERFGHESDTILNVTDDPSPNTSLRFTGTNFDRSGLHNQAYLMRLSQNIGPLNVFLREMGTKDSTLGFGRQDDIQMFYVKNTFDLIGSWTRVEKEFAPRLGFVPETDLTGPFVQTDYLKTYDHGAMSDWSISLNGLNYNHIDGSFYRNEYTGTATAALRAGLAFMAAADIADFEGSKDSLYSFQLQYPRGNPYQNVSVHYDTGRQAGIEYRSVTASTAYRFNKKLQLMLREQHVDYAGPSDQTILSANFDLGRDRAIAGRLVRQGGNTNAYVAFQRSGNEGIEYFLILGDPNAVKYRNSLILKVAVPLRIGHGSVSQGKTQGLISGPISH
jgi:hypothetical protein